MGRAASLAGTLGIRRLAGLLAAAATSALLTAAYLVFVGRALGPVEYSDFAAALALIYFFAVAASPFGPALARVVSRHAARGEFAEIASIRAAVLRRFVLVTVAGVLPLAVLLPLLARWLRLRTTAPLALAVLAAVAFTAVSLDRGVIQGLMRFRAYNASVVVEAVSRLSLTVVLLFAFSATASRALVGYFLALLIAGLMIARPLWREWRGVARPPVDWSELRQLSGPILLLLVAAALMQNADMMALKRWFAPADAGYYGAVVAIARLFGAVFVPLYALVGPMLTDAHERGASIARPAMRVTVLYVALCALPMVVIVAFPARILRLLYGTEFSGPPELLPLLGGIWILMHFSLLLSQVFLTLHRFRFVFLWIGAATIQVASFALFHDSLGQIVSAMYVIQGLLALALSLELILSQSIDPRA